MDTGINVQFSWKSRLLVLKSSFDIDVNASGTIITNNCYKSLDLVTTDIMNITSLISDIMNITILTGVWRTDNRRQLSFLRAESDQVHVGCQGLYILFILQFF